MTDREWFYKWELWFLIILLVAIIISLFLRSTGYSSFSLIIAMIICGIPLTYQIISKILKGDLGADSLAALAIITAAYLGEYLAGTIVLLMLASGQLLETYAIRRASSVLLALSSRMPAIAHRKHGKNIKDIPIHKIQISDEIIIYPHEICPVDGIVIEGRGSMDESYLTGEPYFVSKIPGVFVFSGAINRESLIIIRVTKMAQDSRYAKIMHVMEESEQKRPKSEG